MPLFYSLRPLLTPFTPTLIYPLHHLPKPKSPFIPYGFNISIQEGTDKSYDEIIKICSWLNFDCTNKVFKGATDYIVNDYNEDNDAVNKIIEIALKNEKTYIMAIGAITNVALAIKKEPKIRLFFS